MELLLKAFSIAVIIWVVGTCAAVFYLSHVCVKPMTWADVGLCAILWPVVLLVAFKG